MDGIRITKEVAQERVKGIGRDVVILEWDGTNKPCLIKCSKCGSENWVDRGGYTYTESSQYFYWKECTGCRVKDCKESFEYIRFESIVIDEEIDRIGECIKGYIGKEIEAKKIIDDICSQIRIGPLSVVRFNFSILDRICTYEEIKLSKFGKKGYLIKDVFEKALPKTKKRIELEEKKTWRN